MVVVVDSDLPGLRPVRRLNDAQRADAVLVAARETDGAEVAVRVYHTPLRSAHDRDRFEQEIATLKACSAVRFTVPIEEAGLSLSGHPYVVTEYFAHGSLHNHLATVDRLTPVDVRRIGAQLAGALAEIHRRDIVHRNVKPANIMITKRGEPALTDFGLVALATADRDFSPPAVPRNRPYRAPEAYLPELMTPAADIYALGATLYGLVAGWPPYALNPLAVAVDGDTLADLPRVPWALMTVIRRAMAHDPRDRFPNAASLQETLLT
jgi:serine/threonine protein kinase